MRFAFLLALLLAPPAVALEPKDVFVVANKDMPESVAVAEHYLAKRKVPKENLIQLSLPKIEDITRVEYDTKLAGPLREALKDKKDACKVILVVYGVPLRIGDVVPTKEEQAELTKLRPELDAARKEVDRLQKEKAAADVLAAARKKVSDLDRQVEKLAHGWTAAAVDSELMLLWWPKYELTRWVYNPLYWQVKEEERKKSPPVVLACRLDGPTAAIAKRLVDDSMDAEATGLTGKAYFDARGQKFDVKKPGQWTGYEGYDESFREAAGLMKTAGFDTTLDDKDPVFAANTCPDAALYAGWYSHAKFVDSCTFVKGAVAWHLASSEATTLRRKDSPVWCPNLLKKGVAATMGPVGEPYTVGFPKPAEFFGFLVTGEYTLVECHARTQLLISWMTTLIGDPLYNPFAKAPKLKAADVFPSPKGSRVTKE